MTAVADLDLPRFDYTNPDLRGDLFHDTMQALRDESWIAASEFGFFVLDREAAGFFLRSRKAEFPGVYMFDLLGITDGPLRDSLLRNILTLGGEQHARLRALVQPSFTPKAADRYRPAAREFLAQLWEPVADRGQCDFVLDFAKPYPALMMGILNGQLNVTTAAGSITFNDVAGNVTVNTGGGDISGGDIKGKASLNTAGGSIKLNNTDGELHLNSAGGDIRVERVTKTAEVNTGGGSIILGTIDGKASVRSGGGDVNVTSVSSGLSVVTGGGNMIINDSKGEVAVTTGGGDIKVTNRSGNIKIKSGAGNVTADIVPGGSGENSIITGNGDVKLIIPENSKTTIRVITKEKHREDVQISSDFSLTTENREEDRLITVYQINGGGSTIEIKNGFGNVEIRKKK